MLTSLYIFGAKYLIWGIMLIAGIYFLRQNRSQQKQLVVFAALSLPLTFVAARLMSLVYYNPRPFVQIGIVPLIAHAADNGFPSDHTLLGAAVALVVFRFHKKLGLVLGVLTLAVGLSRVAAGVHHVVDIAGSIAIASVVAWLVAKFLLPLAAKNKLLQN